jgi:hypothetical protein
VFGCCWILALSSFERNAIGEGRLFADFGLFSVSIEHGLDATSVDIGDIWPASRLSRRGKSGFRQEIFSPCTTYFYHRLTFVSEYKQTECYALWQRALDNVEQSSLMPASRF